MSIFKFIPWKSAAGLLPVFVEIIKEAREFVKGDDSSEISELRAHIRNLEQEQASLYRFVRFATVAGIFLFLLSGAALVVGIIALTR